MDSIQGRSGDEGAASGTLNSDDVESGGRCGMYVDVLLYILLSVVPEGIVCESMCMFVYVSTPVSRKLCNYVF